VGSRISLTEDELILFDVLFDKWDTLESLFPENFSTSHNLPYRHSLDEGGVRGVVESLIQRELIQRRTERRSRRDITWLTLSAAGGSLWALERQPVWERFCTDSSWPSDNDDGIWTLSVRSPSVETARAFLNTATSCGLYTVGTAQQPIVTTSPDELIPWRTFEVVHELRVPVSSPVTTFIDWDQYQRDRFWWRDVPELLTLPG